MSQCGRLGGRRQYNDVPMKIRRRQSDARWRANVASCYETLKHIIPMNKRASKRQISKALILQETSKHIHFIEGILQTLLQDKACRDNLDAVSASHWWKLRIANIKQDFISDQHKRLESLQNDRKTKRARYKLPMIISKPPSVNDNESKIASDTLVAMETESASHLVPSVGVGRRCRRMMQVSPDVDDTACQLAVWQPPRPEQRNPKVGKKVASAKMEKKLGCREGKSSIVLEMYRHNGLVTIKESDVNCPKGQQQVPVVRCRPEQLNQGVSEQCVPCVTKQPHQEKPALTPVRSLSDSSPLTDAMMTQVHKDLHTLGEDALNDLGIFTDSQEPLFTPVKQRSKLDNNVEGSLGLFTPVKLPTNWQLSTPIKTNIVFTSPETYDKSNERVFRPSDDSTPSLLCTETMWQSDDEDSSAATRCVPSQSPPHSHQHLPNARSKKRRRLSSETSSTAASVCDKNQPPATAAAAAPRCRRSLHSLYEDMKLPSAAQNQLQTDDFDGYLLFYKNLASQLELHSAVVYPSRADLSELIRAKWSKLSPDQKQCLIDTARAEKAGIERQHRNDEVTKLTSLGESREEFDSQFWQLTDPAVDGHVTSMHGSWQESPLLSQFALECPQHVPMGTEGLFEEDVLCDLDENHMWMKRKRVGDEVVGLMSGPTQGRVQGLQAGSILVKTESDLTSSAHYGTSLGENLDDSFIGQHSPLFGHSIGTLIPDPDWTP